VIAETEAAAADGQFSLQVYVTGDAKQSVSDDEEVMDSKGSNHSSERQLVGRPDLRAIVRNACAASAGRLAIVGTCLQADQPLS
jgi:hypothetical protein